MESPLDGCNKEWVSGGDDPYNTFRSMKLFSSIAAAAVIGASFIALPEVKANTYNVTPSLLRNGGYTINGPSGYNGTYTPSLLNNGGGYDYRPSLLNNAGGTYSLY